MHNCSPTTAGAVSLCFRPPDQAPDHLPCRRGPLSVPASSHPSAQPVSQLSPSHRELFHSINRTGSSKLLPPFSLVASLRPLYRTSPQAHSPPTAPTARLPGKRLAMSSLIHGEIVRAISRNIGTIGRCQCSSPERRNCSRTSLIEDSGVTQPGCDVDRGLVSPSEDWAQSPPREDGRYQCDVTLVLKKRGGRAASQTIQ